MTTGSLRSTFDDLIARLHTLVYPESVVPIFPKILDRVAFFPGGRGYADAFPVGGVMLLGHNFDTEEKYLAAVRRGRESDGNRTWVNFRNFLQPASGIGDERIFFTNFYAGAIRGGGRNVGRFPATKEFRTACGKLLVEQIRAQQPILVATLGSHVPRLIATALSELREWARGSLSSIQARQGDGVDITVDEHSVRVLALLHPSAIVSEASLVEQGRLLGRVLREVEHRYRTP